MFNGIIENQAKFVEFNKNYLILNFFDLTETQLLKIKLGDSIACNGTCLTVTKIDGNKLSFDLAPETILKTNLSKLQTNDILNIEFPMRIGDKINGHLVYGHIYGLGKIISVTQDNIVTIETEKSVFGPGGGRPRVRPPRQCPLPARIVRGPGPPRQGS